MAEIALEYVNGFPFVPFDILDPNKFLPTIFFLRKLFTTRLGADLIIRFLGSIPGQKLYLHFQLWDLYCMKLNFDDETLETPWLLGPGDTDRHIGVSEAYGKAKVGYVRFQRAVDDLIGLFKDLKGVSSVEDIKKITGDRDWRSKVTYDLTSILYMSIEPVRFPWLSTYYYLYDISVKSDVRDTTDGEDKLICSWRSVSDCSFSDGCYDIATMELPITKERVKEAEKDPKLARHCVAVPCITDMKTYVNRIARNIKKMGLQIEGIQRVG
ncbi:hypothetical protein Tco_1374977 [Tanacetum coccineum]